MAVIETEVRPAEKPAELDEVSQVLLRAADNLRRRGWVQKSFGNPSGPRCVSGAMIDAYYDLNLKFDLAAQHRFYESVGMSVFAFNDRPGRTKEQVIEALERAAIGG